jgi:hypothetical protein
LYFQGKTSYAKAFEMLSVNKYAIVSRITANNKIKLQSTVYCTILNHKKIYPLKNLNLDTKMILQDGTAKQKYGTKKTG